MNEINQESILNSRYRPIEKIGTGGFSVVWLVEDIHGSQYYAVKTYAPQQGMNLEDIELFEIEYKRLSTLSHEHIIKTVDYFKVDDAPSLVLEYCSKGSLQKWLKKEKKLDEPEMAKLMLHIGGALHYLHTLPIPIFHLDLKPDNVLINEAGAYILTDFGISNEVRNTLLRRSSIIAETFTYRSPERALNHNLTDKHDVFSFGVVLMECCAGLFDAKYSLADSVLNGYELPKVMGYSNRLVEILYNLLELDPLERPSALDVHNYGKHFIEHGYWPLMENSNKTKRIYDKKPKIDSLIIERNSVDKMLTKPIATALIFIIVGFLGYIFYEIKKANDKQIESAYKTPVVNRCDSLYSTIDNLLQRGKFSSIENMAPYIRRNCPDHLELNNALILSSKCLGLLNSGGISFEEERYTEAQADYTKFINCPCPNDSLGLANARLKSILERINSQNIRQNSIKKINAATKNKQN